MNTYVQSFLKVASNKKVFMVSSIILITLLVTYIMYSFNINQRENKVLSLIQESENYCISLVEDIKISNYKEAIAMEKKIEIKADLAKEMIEYTYSCIDSRDKGKQSELNKLKVKIVEAILEYESKK